MPADALTTVKPYSNEIHAQAQLWLKRDPKASYEAWKKCLPARGSSVFLTLFCAILWKNMHVLLSSCVGFCPCHLIPSSHLTMQSVEMAALTFLSCVAQPLSRKCTVPEDKHFSWAVINIAGVDANGKSPSKAELHQLYLSEKYVWKWKQFMSRRGKRTCPLDLKLGHNNWLRQVNMGESSSVMHWPASTTGHS